MKFKKPFVEIWTMEQLSVLDSFDQITFHRISSVHECLWFVFFKALLFSDNNTGFLWLAFDSSPTLTLSFLEFSICLRWFIEIDCFSSILIYYFTEVFDPQFPLSPSLGEQLVSSLLCENVKLILILRWHIMHPNIEVSFLYPIYLLKIDELSSRSRNFRTIIIDVLKANFPDFKIKKNSPFQI